MCKMLKFYLWIVCLFFLGQCHEGYGTVDFSCPVPNGYFPNTSECDSYFQCRNNVAETKICPDGLFFDDRSIQYPRIPCTFPRDVQCGSRTRTRVKRLPRIGRRR